MTLLKFFAIDLLGRFGYIVVECECFAKKLLLKVDVILKHNLGFIFYTVEK